MNCFFKWLGIFVSIVLLVGVIAHLIINQNQPFQTAHQRLDGTKIDERLFPAQPEPSRWAARGARWGIHQVAPIIIFVLLWACLLIPGREGSMERPAEAVAMLVLMACVTVFNEARDQILLDGFAQFWLWVLAVFFMAEVSLVKSKVSAMAFSSLIWWAIALTFKFM